MDEVSEPGASRERAPGDGASSTDAPVGIPARTRTAPVPMVHDPLRRALQANFFWPLAVLTVVALAIVISAGVELAREFDTAAKQREQAILENGIQSRINEADITVVNEVVWDLAVANLDNHFDAHWAQENIGQFFSAGRGFADSFVLGPDDHPIYAAHQGATFERELYEPFAGAVQSLVAKVRAREERRGRPSPVHPESDFLSLSIQAGGVALIDGRLDILTATLVQPDFGASMPAGRRAPIVVTAVPVSEAFIKSLAERNLIKDLHIRLVSEGSNPSAAHVLLKSDLGVPIAWLEWQPQNPGQVILRKLGLPVLGILIALAGGLLLLYQRGRKAAQGLVTSEARAAHLAYYDDLTGLPNRVLFFDRLGLALLQTKRSHEVVAVHCVDLDRLKGINDTFGHHAGDELIRLAADRMSRLCRVSDTFARLSGDEFAIVQTSASTNAAGSLATRITEAMVEPFELTVGRVYVGCSVGIALIGDASLEPEEALRQADLALYRSKQTAKGKFCFYDLEMDTAVKTRRAMESELRIALARKALYMVYQPQVNADGLVGVEALIRWNHARLGFIAPSLFVPIAEECGLIIELGLFTMRAAFEASKRWQDLRVAINVSANQLRAKDFAERVMELVNETGVDPRRFELEITEGILLGDNPQIYDMLVQLRRFGFSLALDDFGTGYSSLSYLQKYPIDKIKIDRSFVANLGVRAESDAVVDAILSLARALHISVIAEGVETAQQARRLNAAGCSDMQGYFFGKPVSPEEIDALYNARSIASTAVAA